MSVSEQKSAIEQYLIASLAGLLQLPKDKIQKDGYLAEWVDSLIAIELQNKIETDLGIRLAIDTFIGRSTISELASHLLEKQTFSSLLNRSQQSVYEELETETFVL